MARYTASVETPRTRHEVFAYLRDFSSTQEWDPGVHEADRLDHGQIGTGSRFRVVAAGRRDPVRGVRRRYADFNDPEGDMDCDAPTGGHHD